MTDVLTVPTHFGDLSELSQGLIDRVDDGRLILYGPTMFDQGAHVGFRVLLSDESTALEGYGLVTEVYDGGEEREPEIRYDTVLESLELDGRNEVVFERIVLARQSMAGDDPATGEIDISEMEDQVSDVDVDAADALSFASDGPAFEDATEFSVPDVDQASPEEFAAVDSEAQEFEAQEFEASADAVAAVEFEAPEFEEAVDFEDVADDAFESVHPAAEAPAIDVAPPRVALAATDGALLRPVFAASWWPRAEAPEPRPASGWFQYTAGSLPVPPSAPRPELSPELRVSPAPRPGAEATPEPVHMEAAIAEPLGEPINDPAADFEDDIQVADEPAEEEMYAAPDPSEFDEMPLPDGDAEIAPAVEAEYVSVGDANPEASEPEESFADLDDAPIDFAADADEAVDVELDL